MKKSLSKYLPEAALDSVIDLLNQYPCKLKIVNNRRTKHGDFRKLPSGKYQITINNDLNQYRFLLTLIHELAHLATYQQFGRLKPHGVEWKRSFQHLMLHFVNPDVYPEEVLPILANYLKNPKASTETDLKLSLALKKFDAPNEKNFIFEIPVESKFMYNKRIFVKGHKRRTRFGCKEVSTGKTYLFHQNAEVNIIEN